MTGGMAFEALNNAASLKKNFIIVLNDNNMSISENVGGLSEQLAKMRTNAGYRGFKGDVQSSLEKIPKYGEKLVTGLKRTKSSIKQIFVPGMMFEEMGIMYLGPVDGHNVTAMVNIMKEAALVQGPVLIHVLTKKGRGYEPAERHPSRFHGTASFDIETGIPTQNGDATYTDIFSTVMRKMGDRDEKLVAITAAMAEGTGLKRFRNMFGDRFFDVGIAEEHAVTFAAAMAAGGMKPVFAVYSTFLQRAYDQVLIDVCMQNLPVVFAIDRAGLVGSDGETHQGIFDISYLSSMPNMTVMAPKNKWELSDMLKYAIDFEGPIALRYPRGCAYDSLDDQRADIEYGKCEELSQGEDVMLFALGSMVKTTQEMLPELENAGIKPTVVNARFAKPFDREYLLENMSKYKLIVTMEENVITGGMGEQIQKFLIDSGYEGKVLNIAIKDEFVEHGNVDKLKEMLHIDADSITKTIIEEMR